MGPARIAVPLGSMLVLAGTGMIAAWHFEVVGSGGEAPPWLVAWLGGVFIAGGGVVAGRAARHLVRQHRAAGFAERWRRDHPWPLREAVDQSVAGISQHVVALGLMGGLLVPLNVGFVLARDVTPSWSAWIPLLVVGLFDALFLLSAGYLVYRILQRRRFGASRFVFEDGPPFILGGELRGTFQASPLLSSASACTATLRGVHEYMLVRGEDSNHVAEVFFEETARLEIGPAGTAHVRFALPADQPPTSLAEPPTRYWELAITGRRPGIDFEAVFLLPVYAPH